MKLEFQDDVKLVNNLSLSLSLQKHLIFQFVVVPQEAAHLGKQITYGKYLMRIRTRLQLHSAPVATATFPSPFVLVFFLQGIMIYELLLPFRAVSTRA